MDNQVLLEHVLRDAGYSVSAVDDGLSALAWVKQQTPDLILLDLSLPEIDGWEIARRLKADQDTAAIPVIAVTAHAMKGDRERALAAGCNDYISKPIDIEQLEERVAHWLSNHPSPTQPNAH
ncbi:response regulator [Leptolyngbya sp. FACHB-261]|nr:response regulator [Leptolyngbya sp. FACHB-261]